MVCDDVARRQERKELPASRYTTRNTVTKTTHVESLSPSVTRVCCLSRFEARSTLVEANEGDETAPEVGPRAMGCCPSSSLKGAVRARLSGAREAREDREGRMRRRQTEPGGVRPSCAWAMTTMTTMTTMATMTMMMAMMAMVMREARPSCVSGRARACLCARGARGCGVCGMWGVGGRPQMAFG